MKNGWEIKRLSEICRNLDSKRIPITQNKRKKGDIPYYGASGIVDYVEEYIFDEDLLLVSEDGANLLMRTYPIAFSIGGKTWVNNHAHVLRFDNLNSQKYVEYYLNSIKLDEYISGMAQPKLNQASLNNIPVPYPEPSEQKRIVEILDEAFAAIDKAKANVEKNLQNAKELFESYLQNVFNNGKDWEEKFLEDVVDSKCTLSYGIVQPGEDYPNGLPVVRPTDLTQKFISLKGLKLINPSLADSYKRTTLRGNELLLCVRGTTGTISISTKELTGANVTRGIVPIVFNDELLNLEFGYYLFISPFVQKQIKEKTYGAALMQINISDVRKIKVVVPPLREQEKIVETFNALHRETTKLGMVYQRKLDDLEELKKSFLQKAFTGELKTEKAVVL